MRKYLVEDINGQERYITDIQVENVDTKDYPDFCDAYTYTATWDDTNQLLTHDELIWFNEQHPDIIHEVILQQLF